MFCICGNKLKKPQAVINAAFVWKDHEVHVMLNGKNHIHTSHKNFDVR